MVVEALLRARCQALLRLGHDPTTSLWWNIVEEAASVNVGFAHRARSARRKDTALQVLDVRYLRVLVSLFVREVGVKDHFLVDCIVDTLDLLAGPILGLLMRIRGSPWPGLRSHEARPVFGLRVGVHASLVSLLRVQRRSENDWMRVGYLKLLNLRRSVLGLLPLGPPLG